MGSASAELSAMSRNLLRIVGWGAVLAPGLHTVTDLLEWWNGGFSGPQLWLNYFAFLPLPALMIGLYAVQVPRVSKAGLFGAVLYGFAFIYFAHTTLIALTSEVGTYERLLAQLGWIYTVHGALMVAGGLVFAWATARAGVLPTWTARLFSLGLLIHLALALLPLPDLLQIVGSTLRNAGLLSMGGFLVREAHRREGIRPEGSGRMGGGPPRIEN